jgi:predicted MFS family arabinose efflux permease
MLTSVLLALGSAFLEGADVDISSIGWSLTASSLAAWFIAHLLYKLLSHRRRHPVD